MNFKGGNVMVQNVKTEQFYNYSTPFTRVSFEIYSSSPTLAAGAASHLKMNGWKVKADPDGGIFPDRFYVHREYQYEIQLTRAEEIIKEVLGGEIDAEGLMVAAMDKLIEEIKAVRWENTLIKDRLDAIENKVYGGKKGSA